jgi:predicted acetyltransferase
MSPPHSFNVQTPTDTTELLQLGHILAQCFNVVPTDESTYLSRIGRENVRILRHANEMIGGLGILPMGQWYNSARVSMAGIAAVAIAPEFRGKGAAIALIQHTLRELQARDLAISVLYPATQTLYRKAGYEQAGTLCQWEVPTQTIQIRDYTLPMQSVPLEASEFAALYQQKARSTNGNLDRNSAIWSTKLNAPKDTVIYAYKIGDPAEGYVIYHTQESDRQMELLVKDWVLLTPAAIRRFWTFLADHRSQIDTVLWHSSPVDALSLFFPEQTAKRRSLNRWMTRIVNLPQALEQRQYPQSIQAKLHLEIQDELLSNNQGKWILEVANGHGKVTPGGQGDLQLNIRNLAPLYTSLFSAQQLQQCDRLTGTPQAIALASQIFNSPIPWTPDFF